MEDRREFDAESLAEAVARAKGAVLDDERPEAVSSQHERDKLTARERIEHLCDSGTFDEIGQLAAPYPTTPETQDWEREDAPADGIVTGVGSVDGSPVAIGATDVTVKGGSIGHTGMRKLRRVSELALERGFPLVLLHDGGGHRIQEGLDARPYASGGSGMFALQGRMSGWVPMVSAMMGSGFAAPTNYAAFSDFVPMVEGSTMGVAGPALVEAALGVELSAEAIGGATFQTTETGMADLACDSDEACLDAIRTFLSYLPRNAGEEPPVAGGRATADADSASTDGPADADLVDVIPADTKKGYDVYAIVDGIVDEGSFFELKPRFARNLVTGFARIDGRSVGVIANNPRIVAGTITADAADKGSRFVSLCDAFGLPIVSLVDTPGVLPGPDSERQGIARRAGKPAFELVRASVPIVSVVLRRGYGFGYVAMGGGRAANAVKALAWPTAEIAAMGIEGAVDIVYRREIERADDPEARREELIETFADRTGAIRAAEWVGIDGVVHPDDTRDEIASAFERYDRRVDEDWPPKKHPIQPI